MIEVILRNRHGRKRKSGRRHPNGKLVPERGVDRLILAARMPHRGEIPQSLLLDARSECELGRMCLLGRVSEEQYEAGRIFAGVVARYRAILLGPRSLVSAGYRLECHGDANEGPCQDCECQRRREAYEAAYGALIGAGHEAAQAVRLVVIENQPFPRGQYFNPLLWGLSALKVHFGLGPRQAIPRVLVAAY